MFNIFKKNKEHIPPYTPNPEEYLQAAQPVPEHLRPLFAFAKISIPGFSLLGFFISMLAGKYTPPDRYFFLLFLFFLSVFLSTVIVNIFISHNLGVFCTLFKKMFFYFMPVFCLITGIFVNFLINLYFNQ